MKRAAPGTDAKLRSLRLGNQAGFSRSARTPATQNRLSVGVAVNKVVAFLFERAIV